MISEGGALKQARWDDAFHCSSNYWQTKNDVGRNAKHEPSIANIQTISCSSKADARTFPAFGIFSAPGSAHTMHFKKMKPELG